MHVKLGNRKRMAWGCARAGFAATRARVSNTCKAVVSVAYDVGVSKAGK